MTPDCSGLDPRASHFPLVRGSIVTGLALMGRSDEAVEP
jgi:hypothetical protein